MTTDATVIAVAFAVAIIFGASWAFWMSKQGSGGNRVLYLIIKTVIFCILPVAAMVWALWLLARPDPDRERIHESMRETTRQMKAETLRMKAETLRIKTEIMDEYGSEEQKRRWKERHAQQQGAGR